MESRPAASHSLRRVHEVAHVHDAVLQQVAHAAAALGQEFGGVGLLHVLRDHQHRGVRVVAAQVERGAQSLVPEVGWQADVHHRDVRLVARHGVDQRGRVGHGRHHLEAVVAQQALESVTEESQVLRDDYPHGISARMVVGPPDGLSIVSLPSSASTRRASPLSPPPPGFAPPTPLSVTVTFSTSPTRVMRTSTCVARACLPALASDSATTKYAALSTGALGRSAESTDTDTVIGDAAASAWMAAASP